MGETSRAPRWAIAAKFSATQGVTELVDIQVSVGRTGSLTPVAVLAPVNLGGVVVQRASLHNADWLRELDVRVGDAVCVQRAGDVIPQVTGVHGGGKAGRGPPFQMPLHCPVCGGDVVCDGGQGGGGGAGGEAAEAAGGSGSAELSEGPFSALAT